MGILHIGNPLKLSFINWKKVYIQNKDNQVKKANKILVFMKKLQAVSVTSTLRSLEQILVGIAIMILNLRWVFRIIYPVDLLMKFMLYHKLHKNYYNCTCFYRNIANDEASH